MLRENKDDAANSQHIFVYIFCLVFIHKQPLKRTYIFLVYAHIFDLVGKSSADWKSSSSHNSLTVHLRYIRNAVQLLCVHFKWKFNGQVYIVVNIYIDVENEPFEYLLKVLIGTRQKQHFRYFLYLEIWWRFIDLVAAASQCYTVVDTCCWFMNLLKFFFFFCKYSKGNISAYAMVNEQPEWHSG